MKKRKEKIKLRKWYRRVYEKCLTKAQAMMPDKKKISNKIKKARKIFERLHNIPRCDALSKNICNLCDLISDYLDGVYTNLPLATILASVAGILYLVLPIDALADFIPVLGWLDDAAVLGFVIATEQKDINEYLEWKANKENGENLLP
jgi:uncharacterized membrane protein YkvA (DUF1232 family)